MKLIGCLLQSVKNRGKTLTKTSLVVKIQRSQSGRENATCRIGSAECKFDYTISLIAWEGSFPPSTFYA